MGIRIRRNKRALGRNQQNIIKSNRIMNDFWLFHVILLPQPVIRVNSKSEPKPERPRRRRGDFAPRHNSPAPATLHSQRNPMNPIVYRTLATVITLSILSGCVVVPPGPPEPPPPPVPVGF